MNKKFREEKAAFERFKHRRYLARRIRNGVRETEPVGRAVIVCYCMEIARHLRSTEKCGVRS